MNARLNWMPDSFSTAVERRSDGTMILRPNGALGAYPKRLMDRLEHWAQVAPDRVFVARRTNDVWRSVTYREMLRCVERVAAGLIVRQLSPDRPIAILSGNSIEHLTLAFGAIWAGIPYCPVSPAYSQVASDLNKLNSVLQLLTPGLIAAFDTLSFERALMNSVAPDIEIIGDTELPGRHVTKLAALECEPTAALSAAHARTSADTIVKFLLTSGSTGEPKAVITTNRMLTSNQQMLHQAMPFLADEPPVLIDWLPWNHTFGGSHNVGVALYNGGTLYIDDGKPTHAGFATTLRNLREISPTVYFNVPKGYDVLAHHLHEDAQLRHTFFKKLQVYFFAGAALSQHTWDALDAIAEKECGRKIPMLSGLGATETAPSVTFTTPASGRAGVIGLPAAGNVVKLSPVEEKLEIRVRGPNVTPGYWRNPKLTTAAYDDEGYYRLGDAVRLLDPNDPTKGLMFDGRIAEDFKLASGTWVNVGVLRSILIAALSPYAQDIVIAGLNCDYLAAICIPDVAACIKALAMSPTSSYDEVIHSPILLSHLRSRLLEHARRYPTNSMCVQRIMLLPTTPSLDHGEITDKGSINQRAVLRNRSDCVTLLYALAPPDNVVCLD
ncbi:MAG TPA: feruloyl-CoA synthase [Steroidobacteraceae bacterium]|nr:feruloyl-CoA synthase [Steroidobacteraceae bacterium]